MTLPELNDIIRSLGQYVAITTSVDLQGRWTVDGHSATETVILVDGLPSEQTADAWVRYLCDQWVQRQIEIAA